MEYSQNPVNVAPTSTEGHYLQGARKVVNLDEVTESYLVEGKSELVTKNHTTLKINDETCLINCQMEFNPFEQVFRKSED